MEVATGALGTLIPKLGQLLQDEYNLQKGVKKDIEFLSRELESMHAALRSVGEMPREELKEQVRIWARDVRELSYDMEDIVDTFLVSVQGPEPPSKMSTKKLVKKMMNIVTKATTHHEIGQEIKDIKERVKEVAERCGRYKVEAIKPAKTLIDPRITALYTKARDLVGMDEAREELITRLTKGDDMSAQQQRVVSIVGFGGLGKTTLAKTVYKQLRVQFDCTAFVSVSQTPDLNKLLKNMLYELDKQKHANIHSTMFDARQLIILIREFLEDKRYLIVIDDIWDMKPWEILRCSLPENDLKSIIITTTRILVVAEQIGGCYKLKPLTHESSKKLFYGRIFGSEVTCPGQYFQVSEKILKKCGGVPLAIITISGLLANISGNINVWNDVCGSIGSGLASNPSMDSMRKILLLSYYHLPSHLKTCLLYLSIFPEDYTIDKDRLIYRWIAEDFVHREDESQSLYELGESYFNELLNRSLIQAADTDAGETIWSCRVHDMVLDLICSFSIEESFVSTVEGLGNVRRLAIHNRNKEHSLGYDMGLRKLRSFNAIGCPMYMIPQVSGFSVLRVLDLESCGSMEGYDLKHLGKLLHLRFIGLRNTLVRVLPVELGRLRSLQTLELQGSGVQELPPSMATLRGLMCLNADWTTRVPDWIGKLTSLQQLVMYSGMDDEYSARCFVKELRNFKELRVLRFFIDAKDEGQQRDLLESLSNLRKIEVIQVDFYGLQLHRSVLFEPAGFTLSENLRFLELRRLEFSRRPSWINPQDLPNLSHLWLMVHDLNEQDMQIIGGFPRLLYLHVLIVNIEQGDIVTFGSGAFQNLKFCSITKTVKFRRGATPMLEVLDFDFNVRLLRDFDFDFGFENLPCLRQVIVQMNYMAGFHVEVVETAEATLRDAINIHPNHPTLQILMKTADRKSLIPKLKQIDDDGPNKIANSAKEKGKDVSPVESNETGELERTSLDTAVEVTGSLIPKLGKLLKEEYNLQKDVRKQVDYLSRELESIHTAMCKLSDLLPDQLDLQISIWAREIKEASYGMEAVIDTFLEPREVCPEPADSDRLNTFLEKMGSLFEKGKALHEIASAIEDMDDQSLQEVAKQRDKAAFYSKSSVRHGVDDVMDELIRMLLVVDNDAGNNMKTKILPIVRSEGLGKTTLAQYMFDKLSPQFDCGAFVHVGQNADMTKVFMDILTGLDKEKYKGIPTVLHLTQLIELIRESLTDSRFLIVVDDIWDLKAWDMIKSVLIENNMGSVVLTTCRRQNWRLLNWKTCDDKKSHFDGSTQSPPRSSTDLKKLFYDKLFGSEDKCLPELKDMCEKFIATCDEMLSVIIETIGLLASIPLTLKDWQAVYDRRKLALSYPDLPGHTRYCLQYFIMFPKGYEIGGKRLVWAWIAEGFVQMTPGKTLVEVGESYLSELVMGKMIEAMEVDACGKALSCRAYDFVHDFIKLKSIEANFVAISNDSQERAFPDTVQRLSIQGNTEVQSRPKDWLSQVKSLVVSCDTAPSISGFSGLRVMDLGACNSLQAGHLKGISNSSTLTYLVIGGKYMTCMPKEIKKLRHLQTLDLSASGLVELPTSVFQLENLKCLCVNSHTKIPNGIAKMTALQELGVVNITKPELLKKLRKLSELRVLKIAIWSWEDENMTSFLAKLCDNLCSLVQSRETIRSLSIMTCCYLDFMDGLDDKWAPQSLQNLEIRHSAFDKLPSWFGFLSNLSSLTIEVYKLSPVIIDTLGKLPTLGSLSLTSKEVPEGSFFFDYGRFKKLESLKFVSNAMKEMFDEPQEEGTQQLKRLTIVFQASRTEDINKDFGFGLENLRSLEHVRVEIICFNAFHRMVKNAEAAIQKAIVSGDRSSYPHLEIRRLEEESMIAEVELRDNEQEQNAPKKWWNKKSTSKKIRITGKMFRQKRRKELLEHIKPFLDSRAKPQFVPSQAP